MSSIEFLKKAADAYYNKQPIISDAEYDELYDKLKLQFPNNEFFNQVGAPVDGSPFEKVKLPILMSSLNKIKDEDMLNEFLNKRKHIQYCITEKLDGISVLLIYKDGVFIQAITRGDGIIGEDITRNVNLIPFPKHISGYYGIGYIRGEIICERDKFKKYFSGYKNPRNTASGTIKSQHDASACRHLDIYAYHLYNKGDYRSNQLAYLSDFGFKIPNFNLLGGNRIQEYYMSIDRDILNYDIDGLVIEPNDTNLIGDVIGRGPENAVAYKFACDVREVTITDLVWQMGKTGRATPVAIFESVILAGASVQRATLNNLDFIEEKEMESGFKLGIGSKIEVRRSNDVIPEILTLLSDGIPQKAIICPECGHNLNRDGAYLVCNNDECPAQVAGIIHSWLIKIGVKEWGKKTIYNMVDQGMINEPADLYDLTYEVLSNVELGGRVIGSSAEIMLQKLNEKKELPLHVFVGSLGIPMCSRSIVKLIVDAGYDTLEKLLNVTADQLRDIAGFGEIRAQQFEYGLKNKKNWLDNLLSCGIIISKAKEGNLKGKSFCLSGFRDANLSEKIENLGGNIKSSVTKDLFCLIVKDKNDNSSKIEKARKQGTKIVQFDELEEIL